MSFPGLFSPITIGQVTVPNRVMMAAMSSGLADERGRITPDQLAYYGDRARGGVGLVTVEFACVASEYGISETTQVVLDDDGAVPGHTRLAHTIKSAGAVAALQLQLPGQYAYPRPGLTPIAPSDVRSRRDNRLRARGLSSDEVEGLVARFADAARRGAQAGYDILELHGAHGYLLHAFVSPAMNQRTDEWGGDFERRLAFPTAVIRAVKRASGGRPLMYRLSAEDYVTGGLSIEDIERIAPALVSAGVDALDVSTGSLAGSLERTIDPMSAEGWRFGLARRVRAAAGVPVAVTGSRWPRTAEKALASGDIDIVALGRPLLADPDWAAKARRGAEREIRPCTSCNWCAAQVFKHQPTGCAENPRTGRETVPLLPPDAGRDRKVVVVGGGPGGLAAAIQAASVGFRVTLFEAEPALGGGLISSAAPPNKENLLWYRDYLIARTQRSGIDIRLGVRATLADIAALDPFAVIHAEGTAAVSHGIPGEDLPTVSSAYDILLGKGAGVDSLRGPVVVYGGGETGCETAELLAGRGLQVSLVSRSAATALARSAEPLYRKVLLGRIAANPLVSVLAETRVTDITTVDVGVVQAEGPLRLAAHSVVLAQGRRSNGDLHAALKERGLRSIPIGDASQIGRIGDAVHQANAAIRALAGAEAEPLPA